MADEIRHDPALLRVYRKIAREQARLEKVIGQAKAASALWVASQHDTQEARAQHLQWQTTETKRQLVLMSTREHAAHWKVMRYVETQRQIEESLRILRVQCLPGSAYNGRVTGGTARRSESGEA